MSESLARRQCKFCAYYDNYRTEYTNTGLIWISTGGSSSAEVPGAWLITKSNSNPPTAFNNPAKKAVSKTPIVGNNTMGKITAPDKAPKYFTPKTGLIDPPFSCRLISIIRGISKPLRIPIAIIKAWLKRKKRLLDGISMLQK